MPIHQFVSQIKVRSRFLRVFVFLISFLLKMPQGWTDGADRYPGLVFLSTNWSECSCDHTVYSMFPSSTLAHTIQKILASTYIGV